MTYHRFHFLLLVRFDVRAGPGPALVIVIIHSMGCERGVLARSGLLQEFDLRSTWESKRGRVSVNGEIIDPEDSFILLEVNRT